MSVAFVKCPVCKQKLAVMNYVVDGALLVCANAKCDTSLRVLSRRPLRVEAVPRVQTHKPDFRPESYG